MKIQYDGKVDALAIQLRSGGRNVTTMIVAPGVHIDFDEQGRVVALELLDASWHVPRAELERYPYAPHYLTVKEAAVESGLSEITLRRQLRAGRLTGSQRGRDWVIEEVDLWNYLESRDARGRPATNPKARQRRLAASTRARKPTR